MKKEMKLKPLYWIKGSSEHPENVLGSLGHVGVRYPGFNIGYWEEQISLASIPGVILYGVPGEAANFTFEDCNMFRILSAAGIQIFARPNSADETSSKIAAALRQKANARIIAEEKSKA